MPSSEGGTSFLCGSFPCTGDCFGIQVMHHVTEPQQGDELALRQIPMQALRLTANRRSSQTVLPAQASGTPSLRKPSAIRSSASGSKTIASLKRAIVKPG